MQTLHAHSSFHVELSIPVPLGGIGANFSRQLSELFRAGKDFETAATLTEARDHLLDAFQITPNALKLFGELPKDPAVAAALEKELVRFLGAVRGADALEELGSNFPLHSYSPRRYSDEQFTTSPCAVTLEYLRAFTEYRAEAAPVAGMLHQYLLELTLNADAKLPPHPEERKLIRETITAMNAVGLSDTGKTVLLVLAQQPRYSEYADPIHEAVWTSSRVPFVGRCDFISSYHRPVTRQFSIYDEGVAASSLSAHAEIVSDIRQAVPVITAIAKDIAMIESGSVAIEILSALKDRRVSRRRVS